MPFAKAWEKTTASGRKMNSPRKSTATPISVQRTSPDSPVAAVATCRAGRMLRLPNGIAVAIFFLLRLLRSQFRDLLLTAVAPFLQKVDGQQQDQREHQHDHCDRGRAGVVVLVE